MKSEEAIKVLKRMLTDPLEADEFYGIKAAIKAIETLEKMRKVIKEMPLPEPNEVFDEQYTDGYNTAIYGIEKYLKGVEK